MGVWGVGTCVSRADGIGLGAVSLGSQLLQVVKSGSEHSEEKQTQRRDCHNMQR